jgi:hypothetical protein
MSALATRDIVDAGSAQEFMREALGTISAWELDAIADACEAKHRGLLALLGPARDGPLAEEELRRLLRSVFATRRRVDDLLGAVGPDRLATDIHALVNGDGPVGERLERFLAALGPMANSIGHDLASECLHYADPERHWLWTRWMWDPATRTGALALVTSDIGDLDGGRPVETYLRVGEVVAAIRRAGATAGFARIGSGPFGVDVFLACVYGVYVYTAVRLRITPEFTRVMPGLPELCRRLLGVHRMEV